MGDVTLAQSGSLYTVNDFPHACKSKNTLHRLIDESKLSKGVHVNVHPLQQTVDLFRIHPAFT